MFVLADSDLFDDEALPVAANQLLAIDVSHWLMGDEAFTGQTSTEADAPVSHTRKQDVVWFYGTIFLGPALVIAAGVMVTRTPGASPQAAEAPDRRPRAPTAPAGDARSDVMTGRAAAIQGGLAAVGLLAALPHLAARAGARARLGDGDRREQDRTSRTSTTPTTTTPSTSSAATAATDAPVWIHLVPTAQEPTPKPTTRPKANPSPSQDRRPPRRRAICWAPSRPPRSSTSSRRCVSPRAFGQLDAAKLKELGLEAPTRKLDVTVKGEVRHYDDRTAREGDRRASPSCATPATGTST